MVKLFVGNLGDSGTVTPGDLKQLFEQYGSVSECECVKNYAFVHMGESKAAQKALHELNGAQIKGNINILLFYCTLWLRPGAIFPIEPNRILNRVNSPKWYRPMVSNPSCNSLNLLPKIPILYKTPLLV